MQKRVTFLTQQRRIPIKLICLHANFCHFYLINYLSLDMKKMYSWKQGEQSWN